MLKSELFSLIREMEVIWTAKNSMVKCPDLGVYKNCLNADVFIGGLCEAKYLECGPHTFCGQPLNWDTDKGLVSQS